jgi:hypothetical protein
VEFEANWKAHVAQQEKLRREGDPNKYSTTPGNPQCKFFDGFGDNGDGTVTDPRTQLVWKRCSEGQTWNGTACTGQSTEMNWYDAMQAAKSSRFLGKNDWRLPSDEELRAVVGDSGGGCKNNDTKTAQYAVSGTLGKERYLWSYSPYVGDSTYAWYVKFVNGNVGGGSRDDDNAVRLVRASQSSAGAAGLAVFNAEYKKMGVYKAAAGEEARKQQADRAEAAAREERQRAQRCSHLYVGKVVPIRTRIGSVDGIIQGVGHGVATVKYWLVLSKEWKYEEVACDELR